jgi:hypothetical protein
MTINADMEGAPVGGALTMGGREFSAVAGPGWQGAGRMRGACPHRRAGHDGAAELRRERGPVPRQRGRGRIAGPPPATQEERTALAVLYAALLTVACADALGGGDALILDGSFLRDPALCAPLVAALRPGRPSRDLA